MTPPADFSSALVASALQERWGIQVAEIGYAAVGFGSHHWRVVDVDGRDWFATLDDYAGGERAVERGAALGSAFRTARALADAGLAFVVAPRPALTGAAMCEVSRHRWVSVTPWLDAVRMPPPEAQTGRDRRAVVGVLAELHAATTAVAGLARPVDLALPERAQLDRALDSALAWPLDQPYAEAARNVLHENAAHVARALTAYDREAARALESRDTWVLTHGEPHWRNVLVGPAGLHIVDWDTARLAPPARDLWHVTGGASAAEVHELLADYERLTGLSVAPAELRVQSLRWDLEEVALYVAQFSRPHSADDDTATAWRGLSEALSSLASRSFAWAGPAERSSTSGPR